MLFMVIERFKNQDPIPVYKRVRDPGIKFPDLCRELDRAQFRPLLPADGMRRSAAAATMGTSQQPRSRHDIRDRPRRAEQGNPRSRRTVPRRQIAASLARLARFRLRRVALQHLRGVGKPAPPRCRQAGPPRSPTRFRTTPSSRWHNWLIMVLVFRGSTPWIL